MELSSSPALEDWVRAQDVLARLCNSRSFVSGDGPDRVDAQYWFRASDRRVRGEVFFGKGAEGMPGYVHGAAIFGVLDEGLGLLPWYLGHAVVTAELRIRYLRPVRLGARSSLSGQVEPADGWMIRGEGTLVGEDGLPCAVASAVFVEVDSERLAEITRTNAERR